MIYAGQSGEGVPFACRVALGLEECGDEVGGIWYEGGRVLEDGGDGKNGVLADIGVTVLETRPRRGEKGLDELWLAKLAEETQSIASDVLVGMLKVVPNTVTMKSSASVEYVVASSLEPRRVHMVETYQTKIISCLSFPPASSLGQIS